MTQAELFNEEAKAHAGKILAALKSGRALTKIEILRDFGCLTGAEESTICGAESLTETNTQFRRERLRSRVGIGKLK
jgi:hypothetical protein